MPRLELCQYVFRTIAGLIVWLSLEGYFLTLDS